MKKNRDDSPDKAKSPVGSDRPESGESAFEPLEIDRHISLAANQREIFRRFNQNPDLAKMLLINPVLAFADAGITLTPEIKRHVLETIQHSPRMRLRRSELEGKLREQIGETAQPNNPAWVSSFLFNKLRLTPLDTSGYEPQYVEPLNAEIIKRLQARLPKRRPRPAGKRKLMGTLISVAPWKPTIRRFDLEAALPKLKASRSTPPEVTLQHLYFYKDSHPLVRDLLELGIIQRRAFPIHTGDSYRQIKDGNKPNAFRSWIKSIRFSEKPKR